MRKTENKKLELYTPDMTTVVTVPLSSSTVHAGFPSPAEDFQEKRIDLNRELIKHPANTFLARVCGDSMKDLGFDENDLLIVDKSLELYDGAIAVCYIDGEFVLRTVETFEDHAVLHPANESYQPTTITEENDFIVWGIVAHWVKTPPKKKSKTIKKKK